MSRIIALLALLITQTTLLLAAPFDDEIQAIIDSGSSARAHWGVYAVRSSNGDTLADINSQKLFVPASNRKLVTSALVVKNISKDKIFTTIMHTARAPQGETVSGDLVVKAIGDPSWNADVLGGRTGRSILQRFARQVAQSGITQVTGDLVIDTSRYSEPRIMPPGWDWEDLQTIYGSIPSVFGIDSNLAAITIRPATPGNPVHIEFPGATAPFRLNNLTETAPSGAIPTFTISRGLDGTVLTAKGRLAADAGEARRSLPMGKPVEYAAAELMNALENEGVTIQGTVRLANSVPVGHTVAVVESATIPRLLTAMNQPSDNYLAESLYLLAGAELYGMASYEASYKAEERYWKSINVPDDEYVPADGSGLSRRNFITPHALVELLEDLKDEQHFVESLPVSGNSGTLRYRLGEDGMAGRVKAKTGTLTGVSSLSGYVTANSGNAITFSIIVNHYSSSPYSIRNDMNKIVELLAAHY